MYNEARKWTHHWQPNIQREREKGVEWHVKAERLKKETVDMGSRVMAHRIWCGDENCGSGAEKSQIYTKWETGKNKNWIVWEERRFGDIMLVKNKAGDWIVYTCEIMD